MTKRIRWSGTQLFGRCRQVGLVLLVQFGLACGAPGAETDEEMIKRVGVDPRDITRALADFSPDKLPGLACWLRADAGVTADGQGMVSAVQEQSPARLDFRQSDPRCQPILLSNAIRGLPALRFAMSNTRGGRMLAAGNLNLPAPNGVTLVAVARVQTATWIGPFLTAFDTKRRDYSLRQERTTGALRGGTHESLAGGGFKVLIATYDAGARQYTASVGGKRIALADEPLEPLVLSELRLGSNDQEETHGLVGDIAEAMVYTRPLLEMERTALVNFLTKKYALATREITSLASLLPYAYYPSSNELEVAFDADSALLAEYFSGAHRPAVIPGGDEKPGLAFAFFADENAGRDLNGLDKQTPAQTGVLPTLDISAPDGKPFTAHPRHPHLLVFAGYLNVPCDDVYTFQTRPYCDGLLLVDGVEVCAMSHQVSYNHRGGTLALKAGKHAFSFHVLVRNHPVELPTTLVRWASASSGWQPIPAECLTHSPVMDWRPQRSRQAPVMVTGLSGLKSVDCRVIGPNDRPVKQFSLPLGSDGRGQARFALPDLPDGAYSVEWLVTGKAIRLPITFRRIHFPWEKNTLGLEHVVYPPFEPVQVAHGKVQVVDREYTFNALGLCDSVVSKGKELLAAPMALHVETASGALDWKPGTVTGKVLHPDLGVVNGSAECPAFTLQSQVEVEEDGCAKVTWHFTSGQQPSTVTRMWLDIPLKDEMAPLFHYTANDAMRMNYAGATPRGGQIVWEKDDIGNAKSPKWVPTIYRVEPGPSDGVIWDATRTVHWSTEVDPFCPYIWLGQEERGLCWFGGDEHGYVLDGRSPVQQVIREENRVIIRVHLVQAPTASGQPRRIVFGLQASPTKPLTGDWRSHDVPAGGGCAVHPFGGYHCAEKYPDGRDFGIVDKMLDALKTGVVDEEYFKQKDKQRVWLDDKIHDEGDWLKDVLQTAGALKNTHDVGDSVGTGTYTEEHAQYVRTEEWQVFQDEWSVFEFNRFHPNEGNWSQMAPSYRDFAVFYNHEWLKRGVSVYFDNCYHRVVSNPYNQDFIGRTISIWGMRAYNKRVWKALTAVNQSGQAPFHVDFTGHITNGQILPQNTWFTGTLDLEQEYRTDTTRKPAYPFPATAEEWILNGYKLTFPPDYTRAMSMGRTVGAMAHAMHPLNNFCDYRATELLKCVPERVKLADWAMFRVHDMRGGGADSAPAVRYDEYLRLFGYGRPGVTVHNYWEDKPFVMVSDPRVTWLALTRNSDRAFGMLLLQSYREESGTGVVQVRFPDGGALQDLKTREIIEADADGSFAVPLENMQGTRFFLVSKTPGAALLPPAAPELVMSDSFELGLHPLAKTARIWAKAQDQPLTITPETGNPANQVLRMRAVQGSAFWHFMSWPELEVPADCRISLRFRLPEVPRDSGAQGVLTLQYRASRDKTTKPVRLCEARLYARVPKDGTSYWEVSSVTPMLDGKAQPFDSVATSLLGKPIPAIPVDTQWHRLTVTVQGPRQTVKVDDVLVLDAQSALAPSGTVYLSPGYDLEDSAIKCVEVDELSITARRAEDHRP